MRGSLLRILWLKNDGLVLPLSPNINVAVLGPFLYERRALLGSWTLDGKAEETRCFAEALGERAGFGKLWLGSGEKREKIPDEADVVVLALGESEKLTGEAHSLSNITLTSDQLELIRRAKESGKKTVGVLFCGRPLAMTGIADMMDAVLYAWHGGSCTADAVCDILFGDASPCGRLPVTLPRLATHIPLYYNVTSSGRPVNCYYNENPQCCYEDSIPTPFYPFGYGLSYTSFDISEIKVRQYRLSIEQLRNGESFEFSVTVKNTGNRQGTQTVQLYIRDTSASMMRPLRELKAFRKLSLNKGESKTATFFVSLDMLGYYIPNGEYVLEKGKFEIYIGENCLTENFVQIYVD